LRDTALSDRRQAELEDEARAEPRSVRRDEWSFNPSPTPLVDPLGLAAAILLIAILMAVAILVVMI
jgi:hypothetical protein